MRVTRLRVLGFRNLRDSELEPGPGITLLWGPNGAGKTKLLEALFTGLAGRSCRTRNDRETIAFDESLARVEVEVSDEIEERTFLWSFARDGERRHLLDGSAVTPELADRRPPLAVFLPDRLALVKGPPAVRRSHVDRLLGALWPSRADARRRYGRALAQRNALLGRVRAGIASQDSLDAWDIELAAAGSDLMDARRDAVATMAPEFAAAATDLGLRDGALLRYMPRSDAGSAEDLAAEFAERREGDVERGYSGHGPHLDDIALLLAERRALLEARRTPPLMLLDDVMSELDPDRRDLLASRLAEGDGQTLITATEAAHLPVGRERVEIAVRRGAAESRATAGVDTSPAVRTAFAA